MLKHCLLLFVSCFMVSLAFGQTNLKGRVFEAKTRITLADIQIQNLTNHELTRSDDKGRFSIPAKTGDLLVFKGFAYNADTVLVTDLHDREIFLIPHQNFLDEVKVTADSTKNMSHYYDPMFHGQTVVYAHDADFRPTGGVIIRVWDNKKDQHRREHLQSEIKEQQQQDELNRVFSTKNVAKYVPLTGQKLENFLLLYTPDIKVYFRADFNLTVYLNDCYQKYLKLPEDKRQPQKLPPAPPLKDTTKN
jgi:hypothetical protein